ncbi:MAG: rod shape-determining protein MreD [Alphaproteobacteria bacterium]|nr:rod shape-determining protein MreD [Alphaproteobacteria bacterium]
MIVEFLQRLDRTARNCTPIALCVTLVLMSTLPLGLPGYWRIAPNLVLVVVFYWAIFRPDLLPLSVAFGIGLFQDVLAGTPLGLHALILVTVHHVVSNQQRFFIGKSFLVVWWAFTMIAAGAAALMWLVTMGLAFTFVDPLPAVFQFFLTLGACPVLVWFFARLHQYILR